jgi:hypothetical protein
MTTTLNTSSQNTTQKVILYCFCVNAIRHDSSLSKMAHVQGGDCPLEKTIFTTFRMTLLIILWVFGTSFGI